MGTEVLHHLKARISPPLPRIS